MFTIDQKTYDGASVVSLERRAVIEELGASGYTLSKKYLRDTAGTRFEYTITLDSELMSAADYDTLFAALASSDAHSVTFPYGSTTKSFSAFVKEVRDEILRYNDDGNPVFGGLKATFIAASLV